MSMNTSLNSHVFFTCEASGVDGIFFFVGGISALEDIIVQKGFTEGGQYTINGVKHKDLMVFAQLKNNNSIIYCTTVPDQMRSDNATLIIQGKNIT